MVASAMALPADPYAAKLPPKPFAYQYGVKDDYSGTTFDKAETQDDYGNVKGEYKVQLPDGRIQIVSYTADHDNGFVAEVRYGKLTFFFRKRNWLWNNKQLSAGLSISSVITST